ncbi:uncharacterized protein LOC117297890 isoform X2 [Asterias rubens]|uniref:uncharacterized protein LOC117297890 isoform X2 n=1 Tax=Asterias rubens TaxID=7604 RepID=UPI0014554009|nr:uncharacterized protein LOC117297890 isoform X2 [Asterias rubens]
MVSHIKHMANIGYEYSKSDVKFLAGDFANALKINLQDNKPLCDIIEQGDVWYSGFSKRWPDLQLVLKPNQESEARYASQDKTDNYFKELAYILVSNDLLESPKCIYIIDGYFLSKEHSPPESALNVGEEKNRPESASNVSKEKTPPEGASNVGEEKISTESASKVTTKPEAVIEQSVTIIGGGNASGYHIPPYFVIPYGWKDTYLEGSPSGSAGADQGWSNSDVLKNYLQKHFAKYAYKKGKGTKTLVLYDGNKYHLSLFMADWAKKNQVILFPLPPKGSQVTEQQDDGLLGLFKSIYSTECQLHRANNPDTQITKHNFAKLAAKPYLVAMSPSNLKAVFHNAGIYPFSHVQECTSGDFQVAHAAATISVLSDDVKGEVERHNSGGMET